MLNFDYKITNFVNGLLPHNLFFDNFFSFFSQKGSSVLIWVMIIIALILFEEVKDRRFILFFTVSFVLSIILANVVLKNVFRRPRPPVSDQTAIHQTCPKDYSFPSGHATTAFAAASVLSGFDKKRKYFYYLIAGLIGLSRIYLLCHFFFDVFGGAIVGYSISKTVLCFLPLRNIRIR